jgi:hypothetical protein
MPLFTLFSLNEGLFCRKYIKLAIYFCTKTKKQQIFSNKQRRLTLSITNVKRQKDDKKLEKGNKTDGQERVLTDG